MEMTALEYLREKARMTRNCTIDCCDCPLSETDSCLNIEYINPQAAIDIVQKWAQEHPRKTILQDFLEKYPNAPLDEDGVPKDFCPYDLGIDEEEKCIAKCKECWNRPMEG